MHDDCKINLFHVMVPKRTTYVKCCDGQTKFTYLLIEDVVLLENYNTIWNKVSADIKKECDTEPENIWKTKWKLTVMKPFFTIFCDPFLR